MKEYYRVMLGRSSAFASIGFAEGFIGADFEINQDLTTVLPDDWRDFNRKFRPIFLTEHPGKSKIAVGMACGALWTVAKGIRRGDLVLCPDGLGTYHVGEVSGEYRYAPGHPLPHRRPVKWLVQTIHRSEMSDALKNSTGSIGTVSTITPHATEIEELLGRAATQTVESTDETIVTAQEQNGSRIKVHPDL